MKTTANISTVRFSTRGRVTVPAALRRRYGVKARRRVVVEATAAGILLKVVGRRAGVWSWTVDVLVTEDGPPGGLALPGDPRQGAGVGRGERLRERGTRTMGAGRASITAATTERSVSTK